MYKTVRVIIIALIALCITASCSGSPSSDVDGDMGRDVTETLTDDAAEKISADIITVKYGETSELYGDPQNIRQMYALADVVVQCKVLRTDMSKYDVNNPYYIPMSILVEKVYKGEGISEGETVEIAAVGGMISQTEYRDSINEKYAVSDTAEGKVILTSGDKKDVLLPERSYILCLTYIPDVEEEGPIPSFPFRYVPINGVCGFYEIRDDGVYVGTYDGQNPFSAKSELLENITDESWLTYVEKPAFAKEISYIPADTKVSLVSSQSREDFYYMCYSTEKSEEFPLGVAYHIRQAPLTDTPTLDFYAALVDEFEFITLEYLEINGVEVKCYEFKDVATESKTLYFVHGGIEFSIEGVCVPDITELVKIAEGLIK